MFPIWIYFSLFATSLWRLIMQRGRWMRERNPAEQTFGGKGPSGIWANLIWHKLQRFNHLIIIYSTSSSQSHTAPPTSEQNNCQVHMAQRDDFHLAIPLTLFKQLNYYLLFEIKLILTENITRHAKGGEIREKRQTTENYLSLGDDDDFPTKNFSLFWSKYKIFLMIFHISS